MKTLRKSLTSLAILVGTSVALSKSINDFPTTPLWREVPGAFVMEEINDVCTLTPVNQMLCSVLYPSTNQRYWKDASKSFPPGGYSHHEVFARFD